MLNPFKLDLAGDRWVAFIRELPILNIDLTDATFKLQVRAVPDTTGTPLVDLSTVTLSSAEGVRLIEAVSDTITNHIADERLKEVPQFINPDTAAPYEATDTIMVSKVGIRINETTMEGLPWPVERGDDLELAWDLHITPDGSVKDKYVGGKFTVRAGATQ